MTTKYNILITGVAGFLGSHLSQKLLDLGHKVIGVDNMIFSLFIWCVLFRVLESESIISQRFRTSSQT